MISIASPRLKVDSRKMIPLDVAMTTFGLDSRHSRRTSEGGKEYFGPCPRPGCSADKDGFSVRETSSGLMWDCHTCRSVGGVGRGEWYVDSLLASLGLWHVLDRCGALESVGARVEYPSRPVEKAFVEKVPDAPKFDDLSTVNISFDRLEEMRTAEARKKVMSHLVSYNITPAIVDRYMLGYATDLDERHECSIPAGFAFPNISTGPNGKRAIRGVSIRRDDAYCKALLLARGMDWVNSTLNTINSIRYDAFESGQVEDYIAASLDDLVDLEPGWDKYKSILTSQVGIWNDELVTLPDNSRKGPWLTQCFIVEGARDALALLQMGYPAVAFVERNDWLYWLPRVFHRVSQIWVVGDRDEAANNKGVGWHKAEKIAKHLAAGQEQFGYDFQVVLPPVGIDDISTLSRQEGRYGLKNWVEGLYGGMKPELTPFD